MWKGVPKMIEVPLSIIFLAGMWIFVAFCFYVWIRMLIAERKPQMPGQNDVQAPAEGLPDSEKMQIKNCSEVFRRYPKVK